MSGHDNPAPPAPLPDILTLREACALTGKSERTLRRWLASGALADLRPDGAVNAPCRIRTAELRAYLATLPEPLPRGTPAGVPRPDVTPPAPEAALVDELRARVDELRGDKVRALADLDATRAELAREREDLALTRRALEEERQARAALERTVAEAARTAAPSPSPAPPGGLRGLLSGLLRRG